MTIEDATVVDAIGTNKSDGSISLSIFNHLPWERSTLLLLQEKVNCYLGFIESGELARSYPPSSSGVRMIDVYCKYRPTQEAEAFQRNNSTVLKEYGVALRYTHSGNGYTDDT